MATTRTSSPRRPKAKKGTVQIKISHERLQLVFSWQGQRYYLSLGVPDTAINRKAAEQKARQIELDFVSGNFDPTLDKYRPENVPKGKAQEITPMRSIWSQYMEYKSPHVSPKTINSTYDPVTSHMDKCRTDGLKDPIKFRRELLKVTTESQARRTLMQLCPKPGHRGSRAVIEVTGAASAPVVLHNPVIAQTTSPISDNGFALAVGTTHRQIALYTYILAITL